MGENLRRLTAFLVSILNHLRRLSVGVWLAAIASFLSVAEASSSTALQTRHVLLVMGDGVRWQEVFTGAEEQLINKESGGITKTNEIRKAFWRDTPQARREALMPFFWNTLAKEGQLYGNQFRGSIAHVTNGKNFSYPGYSEILTGAADPRIDSNAKKLNPNVTVLEWFQQKPAFRGRVAAFGNWEVIPYIINRERSGVPIWTGFEKSDPLKNPFLASLEKLVSDHTPTWGTMMTHDTFIHAAALQHLKTNKPRLMYVCYGEPDEWAHEARYDHYLQSIHHFDRFVSELWNAAQSDAEMRGHTSLLLITDHGRGTNNVSWKNHGQNIQGSGFIWAAALGPDTPALGERTNIAAVTQNQIAATAAALLGEDYRAAFPKAGAPVADVLPKATAQRIDFIRDIQPLFTQHCLSCHGPEKQKNGYRVDVKAVAIKGGDTHGTAIVPGKSADSPLIRYVSGQVADMLMPPKGARLTEREIGLLRGWIDQGANWPDAASVAIGNRLDWWSLKPLTRPTVPTIKDAKIRIQNPVDAFVVTKLKEKGLAQSPEADRRTLIRRLSLDLLGLPPTPERVERFVKDPDPKAYEKLVDELLASPHYGERWARHWLDVVHYGESNGFGMDRPRFQAWPYRDYVIASLNADKPYPRFVQEQLAADALFPADPALTPALGFAAAGPFNQSALVEQVDGTDCKRIALNLDRDDMVASTASTFLSMTVHCARCHEHKFDPISQQDYYRLQAVFAGVGRTERIFDTDPKLRVHRAGLRQKIADLEKNSDAHPATIVESNALATAQVAWEKSFTAQAASWTPLQIDRVESTNSTTTFSKLDDGSWLVAGAAADKDTYTIRARITLPKITALRLEVLPDDRLPMRGPGRQDNGNLHLSEFRASLTGAVETEKPKPLALRNASADFNQVGWGIERALDGKLETAWGIYPQIAKPHHAVFEITSPFTATNGVTLVIHLDQLHGQQHLIGRFRLSATDKPQPVRAPTLPLDLLAQLARPESERTVAHRKTLFDTHRLVFLKEQLAQLPAEERVWAIASNFAPVRNYKPTKEPAAIAVLQRGNINQPLAPVGPGALAAVSALPFEFAIPNIKDESARRAALARWITSPENMLTWRSIVNRVWHWHFGRGLVETPNDFGRMGSLPTHPELLDWLAVEFRDSGGSLKQLHKLIVTSATYRQTSTHQEIAARLDSDNRFLSRMNRPRLDAETVRDALLAASGKMDLTMGGPSAMQFKFDDPNKEVSPRIDYAGFDPDSPASYRRSIYRFLFRNLNDPLLEALDAVDPSLSTPKRNATITPLQALSLWNNRFVLRQCEHLAARVEREAIGIDAQIARAFHLLCARAPTPDEAALLTDHARRHGLAHTCRVLVNLNEFLFVN